MLLKRMWQSFTGTNPEDTKENICKSLDKLNIKYTISRGSGLYLFDPKTQSYIFNLLDFQIMIYSATGDPFQRVLFKLLGRYEQLDGISMIRIKPINKENENQVKKILKTFAQYSEEEVFSLDRHPRFQSAFLLRYKVRKQWKEY